MRCTVIKRVTTPLPKTFILKWLDQVEQTLRSRKIPITSRDIVVVFVSDREMKTLNHGYRGKNAVTDILSFNSLEEGVLGELVLAPSVVRRQAKEHGLSFQHELGYMLLHGVLHLLGYDHEESQRAAKVMFKIQDDVFEELCQTRFHVLTGRKRRSKKKSRKSS